MILARHCLNPSCLALNLTRNALKLRFRAIPVRFSASGRAFNGIRARYVASGRAFNGVRARFAASGARYVAAGDRFLLPPLECVPYFAASNAAAARFACCFRASDAPAFSDNAFSAGTADLSPYL